MPILGQSVRDDIVCITGGLILLAALVGATHRLLSCGIAHLIYSQIKALREAAFSVCQAAEDEVNHIVVEKMLQQKVDHFRITCQIICGGLFIFTAMIVYHIPTQTGPRTYTLTQDFVHLAIHGVSALICFCPSILSPRNIDFFYVVIVLGLALSASPIGPSQDWTIPALMVGNIGIGILTMVRRSLHVVAPANLVFTVAACSLLWVRDAEDRIMPKGITLTIQCTHIMLVTGVAVLIERGVKAVVQQGVEVQATKEMLSAANALLRTCCDVVVELDAGGLITNRGTDLGVFLVLGGDEPLEGKCLTELMTQEEDRYKFQGKLKKPQTPGLADAMHVRMKDGNGILLELELLLFQFCSLDNQPRFLVGLREFSDVLVCRGQRARQVGTAPGNTEHTSPPANRGRVPLPESVPVLTTSPQDPAAVVVLDCTAQGYVIKQCSSGFLAHFGRVAPETRVADLVGNGAEFQGWVQASLNGLTHEEDTPDFHVTLNMPQGPVRATCRVISETAPEEGNDGKGSDVSVTLDLRNVRVAFFETTQSRSQGRCGGETKGTTIGRASL